MAITPSDMRLTRRHLASIVLAIALLLPWLLAPAARAAPVIAANYASTPLHYYTGASVQSCRGWGGDADDAGHFYSVCLFLRDTDGNGSGDAGAPALVEYDAAGKVVQIGWLPGGYWFGDGARSNYVALDVGVSYDGDTAYVTTGPNLDNLGQHPELHPYTGQPLADGARSGAVLRLTRQANGTWRHDTGYRAGPFLLDGNYWGARRLDVDAAGRVYVSVNSVVHELHPQTGAIVTSFGGGATTDGPGGRWIEGLDKPQGLAVSADGSAILVVDQQHQVVQRWLRVGATDWTRDRSLLLGVPDEVGDFCATTDHFQSPYDVAVDGAGDIYVMDTTCNRVQRFTRTGAFVQTVWQDRGADTLELSHGFAVSWNGSIMLPSPLVVLTRSDPPSRPIAAQSDPRNCTDRTALRIVTVRAPRSSATRRIQLTVTTAGGCPGAAQVRVGGERVGRATWTADATQAVSLGGWNGRKRLVVQVRDVRGRTASRVVSVVLALPQPTLVARSSARIAGSGCSSLDPLTRVVGAAGYRIVDRCARITGRAVRVQRRGSASSIQVLLPTTAARAIYANAVGPVRVWVVTDTGTRVTRAVRVGHGVTVLGSVVAPHDLAAAHVVAVDRITGS